MGWLPGIGYITGGGGHSFCTESKNKSCHLGILAFEAAKIMSRLVSLYRSLSNEEIFKLREEILKSQGVVFLNSRDEKFLLSLACKEMLEDLDRAAATVSRLGKKCSDFGLNRFDLAYVNLKLGIVDYRKLKYGSRLNEKRLRKMQRLISATSRLHAALEALTELEQLTQQKTRQGKNKKIHLMKSNFDPFTAKLMNQRKMVHHFRGISLWCKTFDKSVGLMARIVCVVYVRICAIFGQYVPNLTSFSFQNMGCFKNQTDMPMIEPVKEQFTSHSGPITMSSKATLVRFHSQKTNLFFNEKDDRVLSIETFLKKSLFHSAGPLTLGGSGLALRYANVILLAEKYLDPTESIDHIDRESLYQMLPENLKVLVRTKLSKNMKCAEDDFLLAIGWREAMTEMLGWLAPVARDTVKWQMERSFEKMKFHSKPSVLLLQTLHFSDKEKTEAAIAELLVGLSCVYRHENRQIYV
ncbi:protein PSK SIMULATOR 3-like [Henckelia pumila]|uniref:protein PSK SIMULATOR 3-like n=1 Tax=Henckelia pumila TaxID=405737 RepID=UPI003C6E3BA9